MTWLNWLAGGSWLSGELMIVYSHLLRVQRTGQRINKGTVFASSFAGVAWFAIAMLSRGTAILEVYAALGVLVLCAGASALWWNNRLLKGR